MSENDNGNGKRTPRRIGIFDTTLRDGEQAPGNAMSAQDKLELALRLEALDVDVIEAGFPASSPNDFDATQAISAALTKAKVATLARARRDDVEAAVQAAGSRNHVIQIMGTGSDVHLEHKLGITRQQAIEAAVDAAKFAVSLGIETVGVGIEDATRGDYAYLQELTERTVEAGSRYVPIADTSGCATPGEFGELIGKIREWAPAPVRIGVHCHNDFGLATANAIAGLQAGADDVQVTVGGIGERAGNTAMEEVAALLAYKSDELGLYAEVDLAGIYEVYQRLREIIRLEEPRNKAIFGKYAFGTAAGIHQAGMLRNPSTYEYVEPSRFGRERTLLISRHSGRAVLRYLLADLNLELDNDKLNEVYREYISERIESDCEDISVLRERLAADLVPASSGAGVGAGVGAGAS